MKKRITILGSTGSIGTQALEIIRQHRDKFTLVGLTTHGNIELLLKQIEEFQPEAICITDPLKAKELKTHLPFYTLTEIATLPSDLVINALVGSSGLLPTLEAIKQGIPIGLANKETLVIGGEVVMGAAAQYNVPIIPIDSEHSALFQSLKSGKREEIRNLILTMGKGKIAEMDLPALRQVSMADIFSRPAWNMGFKVSVDSATCINKTFEIIEAKWLFDVLPDQIKVIVHPDYICHSLVEFQDGSILTELGTADMRRYTQYALFYPERVQGAASSFSDLYGKTLRFEEPAYHKFPCLSMGHQVLKMGGIMPAVLHGADHAAVAAFAQNKIGFMDIPKIIEKTLEKIDNIKQPDIHTLLEAEKEGQRVANSLL